MRTRLVLIAIAVVGFAGSPARGRDAIVVESKTTCAGCTTSVGIYLSNVVSISGLSLPLEFRTGSGGSFTAYSLSLTVQGRVAESDLMDFAGLRFFGVADSGFTCSGPLSSTYSNESAIDFQSSDGLFWWGVGMESNALDSGTDGEPGSGTPSFVLSFGTNANPGHFEIDTCCVSPANHLLFEDFISEFRIPSFSKGIITTLPCECPCQGDPVCDSTSDVLDVVAAIDEAFRSAVPVADSLCPYISRADANCDSHVNVLDVVAIVNRAFRGDTAGFCDPCTAADL
jgi:hypothetical protein